MIKLLVLDSIYSLELELSLKSTYKPGLIETLTQNTNTAFLKGALFWRSVYYISQFLHFQEWAKQDLE